MDDKTKAELAFLVEMVLQRITEPTLKAIVSATRRLADGLSSAEEVHLRRHEELRDALVELFAARDPAKMTAEQLADAVPHAVICATRKLQWQRGQANTFPAPLPPTPEPDMNGDGEVFVHRHHLQESPDGKKREDDSIVIRTGGDGAPRLKTNINVKTLIRWIVGGALAAIGAWHLIAEHLAKR